MSGFKFLSAVADLGSGGGGMRDMCSPQSIFFHFHAVFDESYAKEEVSAPLSGVDALWEILDLPLIWTTKV